MLNEVIRNLKEFMTLMKQKNISAFAASTAFFLFLSLTPMLIMICTILPFTPLTEQNLITAITDITPDVMDPLVVSLVNEVYEKSAGILSIALLTTLWSAGKGVMALMNGLNAINDVEEERNYFIVRFVASFYTLVVLIMIILSLFIMVFGNALVDVLLYRIPQLQSVVSFMMNFRFIVVWLVLTVLFAMIYAYIPNRKLKFKEQLPGAMFSAIVWSVVSWGFSIYVGYTNFGGMYGSLTIVIIIMLWMYFCMYIVMVGGYMNQYLEDRNNMLNDGK